MIAAGEVVLAKLHIVKGLRSRCNGALRTPFYRVSVERSGLEAGHFSHA